MGNISRNACLAYMRLQDSYMWDYGNRSHRPYRGVQEMDEQMSFFVRRCLFLCKAICEAPCALGRCMVLSGPCLPFVWPSVITTVKGLSLVFSIFPPFHCPWLTLSPTCLLDPFEPSSSSFQYQMRKYFWQEVILASFYPRQKKTYPKSVTAAANWVIWS